MREVTPSIYIDGKEVDFVGGTYNAKGGLTAAMLEFVIPGESATERKFWQKPVVMYLNEQDSLPFFRGQVGIYKDIRGNSVSITAYDKLGLLTGHDKALINFTEYNNIDGLSIGAAIRKMIDIASYNSEIGTSYIGNTDPIMAVNGIRGPNEILKTIKDLLSKSINDDSRDLPRPNILRIVDDGSKTQMIIELQADTLNGTPAMVFNEWNNIIDFNIRNRRIPTSVVVTGKNNVTATYTHSSAASAYDRYYVGVSNKELTSPAACMAFGRKIFAANINLKKEFDIISWDGAYLPENALVKILVDDKRSASGLYRVIGKQVVFDPSAYQVALTINKRPPILSDYIK